MQETHKLSDNLAALKEKIETGLEGLSNSILHQKSVQDTESQ